MPTALLTEAFTGWHPEVLDVLEAPLSVQRWPLSDRDISPRYCSNRIVLVGDAAHPMLPYLSQGANQAFEDIAVLADCLTSSIIGGNGDLPTALRRYDTRRRIRTAEVHRQSRARGVLFHLADGTRQRRRDHELANQDLKDLGWLYGHDPGLTPG